MPLRDTIKILERYLGGRASLEEEAKIDKWYEAVEEPGVEDEKINAVKNVLYNRIRRQLSKPAPVVPLYRRRFFKIAAAAVLIIAVGSWWLVLSRKQQVVKPKTEMAKTNDIAPGHDGAILTLADGRKIVLDSAANGKITEAAVKNGNRISYKNSEVAKVEFNTMTTPKGRQYSLVLPDGSQVWLNAASSITYPTAFVENERKVSITGEAYFEVVHDATKPFHVDVNGMDVQVLGTHFNINSYSDEESINTTLLQGSIKITAGGKIQLVKPGEQTQVTKENEIKLVRDAEMEQVMAWKNGRFQFSDASLQQVMRQIQRWYDVDVVYEANIPGKIFEGKISMQSNLSQVLKILQESGIHFEINDKKLIVKP